MDWSGSFFCNVDGLPVSVFFNVFATQNVESTSLPHVYVRAFPKSNTTFCPYCKQTRLASTWYQNANYLDQYYPQKIHQNCKKIRFKGTTHGLHFRMVEGYSSCVLYVSYFMMRLIKIFVVVHVLTISYVDVLFS